MFFYTKVGFTQPNLAPLCDNEGFVQLTPGSNKRNNRFNITGIDKIHLNVIAIMDLLLMVFENLFCIVLPLISLQDIKDTKNQELDFLKS